jgi:hypothetical protein
VTLDERASQIESFSNWNHADKIRFFAWFLHQDRGQETFTAAEIQQCFGELHLQPPSAVQPFLTAMERRKPKELLRSNGRYRLERRVREDLDRRFGKRAATVAVDKLLSELPQRVPNLSERTYLDEALVCFRYRAVRAAIVMTWNLAYNHLCEFILAKHLATFNAQLPKSFPKADIAVVSKRDDFSELKESQVLQVARSANIVSGSLHKILKEKLDRRNVAAHPSGVVVSEPTAEEFIKDLIENVVVKLL